MNVFHRRTVGLHAHSFTCRTSVVQRLRSHAGCMNMLSNNILGIPMIFALFLIDCAYLYWSWTTVAALRKISRHRETSWVFFQTAWSLHQNDILTKTKTIPELPWLIPAYPFRKNIPGFFSSERISSVLWSYCRSPKTRYVLRSRSAPVSGWAASLPAGDSNEETSNSQNHCEIFVWDLTIPQVYRLPACSVQTVLTELLCSF